MEAIAKGEEVCGHVCMFCVCVPACVLCVRVSGLAKNRQQGTRIKTRSCQVYEKGK